MRASDLLGATVTGPDDAVLGRVLDIRVVQDGPLLGASASLRVDGLVVGRRAMSSRLGFDRAGVGGPALVRMAVRRLMAGNRYLPWDQVTVQPDGIVRARTADLAPVPELPRH